MRLQVGPEIDLAELFRSEQQWAALTASVGELFDPQCRTVAPGVPGTEPEHVGLDGLRAAWLSWLEPWLTYRAEIKQAVDGGDRVLLLTEDYGRQAGSAHEVKVDGSAVWTVGDGKIVARRVLRAPRRRVSSSRTGRARLPHSRAMTSAHAVRTIASDIAASAPSSGRSRPPSDSCSVLPSLQRARPAHRERAPAQLARRRAQAPLRDAHRHAARRDQQPRPSASFSALTK